MCVYYCLFLAIVASIQTDMTTPRRPALEFEAWRISSVKGGHHECPFSGHYDFAHDFDNWQFSKLDVCLLYLQIAHLLSYPAVKPRVRRVILVVCGHFFSTGVALHVTLSSLSDFLIWIKSINILGILFKNK